MILKFNMFNIMKKGKDRSEDDDLDLRGGRLKNETEKVEKEKVEKADDKGYKKFPSSTYTQEEQSKLLIGYDRVPEEAWKLLAPHTHIRYITKAGKFCRGGFIHNVKTRGKEQIFLETGFDAKALGYAKWPVTLEDVAEIWKKRTAADVRINEVQTTAAADMTEFRTLVAENAALRAEVSDLNAQVDLLAADQKRLVQVLSRMDARILRQERQLPLSERGTGPVRDVSPQLTPRAPAPAPRR